MSENLHEALFRFALGHPLEHPDKVKKEVLEQASRTPLIHVIGASIIDDKGRTTAKREPLWDSSLKYVTMDWRHMPFTTRGSAGNCGPRPT